MTISEAMVAWTVQRDPDSAGEFLRVLADDDPAWLFQGHHELVDGAAVVKAEVFSYLGNQEDQAGAGMYDFELRFDLPTSRTQTRLIELLPPEEPAARARDYKRAS